jgi:Fur family zinc uptake transcriptional regulator
VTSTAFTRHDHAHCRIDALTRAQAVLDASGGRLTPVRRRTLEILWSEHRAFGAYEVLDRLAESGFARQPPVAYRALDFLVEAGLAHRIRRLNAFAACSHPGEVHAPLFLICDGCHAVAETAAPEVRAAVDGAARAVGFAVARANVEAAGLCPACAAPDA